MLNWLFARFWAGLDLLFAELAFTELVGQLGWLLHELAFCKVDFGLGSLFSGLALGWVYLELSWL